MTMGEQLQALWRKLLAQPRALAGLVLLLWLGWVALLLDWDERRVAAQEQLLVQQRQLVRLQGFAQEQQWLPALQASQAQWAQVRERLWHQESEGRIQAYFQDWLRAQLDGAGLKVVELSVALPQAGAGTGGGGDVRAEAAADAAAPGTWPPDLRLVRAQMTLEFDAESLAAFLTHISAQERWLWLQRLQVHSHTNRRSAELELGALFSVGTLGSDQAPAE